MLRLERDDRDRDAQCAEGRLPLPQLRQMLSARQSPEVSMKHEEQPAAPVLPERVTRAVAIEQIEVDRGGPDPAFPHAAIVANSARAEPSGRSRSWYHRRQALS